MTTHDLQSFMSGFLGQCDYTSIYVVSDNARIPQQQAAPSGPVSPRGHFDYYSSKGTNRWDSADVEEAMPPAPGPPVRQASIGEPVYPARASTSPVLLLNRNHSLP